MTFPEPAASTAEPSTLLDTYLHFYRTTVIDKINSLPTEELYGSRLPSAWTPLELVNHLAFMEHRWFGWGFAGEPTAEPWGDEVDDRWVVPASTPREAVIERLQAVGARTSEVLANHDLAEIAAVGGRFGGLDGQAPPTLAWICFHVLQEYARHAGHLDIAVELAGGPLGE